MSEPPKGPPNKHERAATKVGRPSDKLKVPPSKPAKTIGKATGKVAGKPSDKLKVPPTKTAKSAAKPSDKLKSPPTKNKIKAPVPVELEEAIGPERSATIPFDRTRFAGEVVPKQPDAAAPNGDGAPEGRGPLGVVRDWVRAAVVDNAGLKAVAFVLALTVFILVQSENDAITASTVGVSYTEPVDREVTSELPNEVRVTLKGSRRRINRLSDSDLERIYVNLSDRGSGEELLFRGDMIRGLPRGLEVVTISPPSVRLMFERKSAKEVPVRVQVTGAPAYGYRVESSSAAPSSLRIRGGEKAIAAIGELRTEPVDLSDRTETVELDVGVEPMATKFRVVADGEADERQPRDVRVRATIKIVPTQSVRRVEDVTIALMPSGALTSLDAAAFDIRPAKVTVVLRGETLALDKVDGTALAPKIELHGDDVVTRKRREATVVLAAPDGIGIEIQPSTVTLVPR